jgi:hypothetical protein
MSIPSTICFQSATLAKLGTITTSTETRKTTAYPPRGGADQMTSSEQFVYKRSTQNVFYKVPI